MCSNHGEKEIVSVAEIANEMEFLEPVLKYVSTIKEEVYLKFAKDPIYAKAAPAIMCTIELVQ
tara:strand:+ start:2611 stop:2799 length:189 start_codon:yes stop_codon:yes gene_type:complete